MIKAASGKTIKFFANRGVDIKSYTNTNQNVSLRLVEPVAGQANVVEVDGKLYFQYKKELHFMKVKLKLL